MTHRFAAAFAATALATLAAVPAAHATDVGVSVQVSQPGVYGRIDIGRFPQPQVVVAQPVIVAQPRVVAVQPPQPVYMWVPPGHQKKWRKHCHRYNACGTPVYFVQDGWYHQHVMAGQPQRRERDDDRGHERGRGHGKDHGKGHGKSHGKSHD